MRGTGIRTAFVSTNSITQGEQVAGVWKPLYERFGIHIDFAHRTFCWDSEASLKAHVHCVIVGFSVAENSNKRRLYEGERYKEVENINGYLIEAPNVFLESRKKPINNVPEMIYGNKPTDSEYIIVPRHSSQTRKYIPFGFVKPEIIVNDAVQIIPNASRYHFGIMMSNIHMAWTRAVCGRIKSDYRYSKDIVYNNFPWPEPTEEQKARIERTAQGILDARALYTECSLADLYDETTMPPELRKAHQQNDMAVMQA